jgi:hypothetical protein
MRTASAICATAAGRHKPDRLADAPGSHSVAPGFDEEAPKALLSGDTRRRDLAVAMRLEIEPDRIEIESLKKYPGLVLSSGAAPSISRMIDSSIVGLFTTKQLELLNIFARHTNLIRRAITSTTATSPDRPQHNSRRPRCRISTSNAIFASFSDKPI